MKTSNWKLALPTNCSGRRILLISIVQGTKNCMTKSREALFTVLTVIKPCLPLTLLTRFCKDGKIVSSLVIEHNITDQTQWFHYHKKDMAAYTFSYHMNGGCVLETNPFWGISMFRKHCSGTDLTNIHSVIVHCVSRKTVNAGFSFRSCLITVHAFTRIKETRIKIKIWGIIWMDWSTMCIHLWFSKKTHGLSVHQYPQ